MTEVFHYRPVVYRDSQLVGFDSLVWVNRRQKHVSVSFH